MGGIVTGVREGRSKSDKPYGIVKIEDYSGSGEIAFFGNDWIKWNNYLHEGYFLYIKAKCVPKQYRPNEMELKVSSIELLPDIKDSLINNLTIITPLESIDEEFINNFTSIVNKNPGNTELYFRIKDLEGNISLCLMAKKAKVSIKKELMSYLDSRPGLEYKFNEA